MKLRHAAYWLAIALTIQVSGLGSAQAENTSTKRVASSTNEDDLSLLNEDVKSLSSQEKLNRGAKKIQTMRSSLTTITELLQSVRDNERDILKINCINEKHAAIKGFLKVSEQSYIDLKSAVDKGDGGAANHHYTLISVAFQKVQSLSEEARLCTGEERRFAGQPEIEVIPPLYGDDHVDVPEDELIVEDLPALTPYQ